ncbi:MAG: hypothetical protein HFJ55_03515 [Clostridia bacterium]|nr:hypothetical protein [Clostridia bacterium]
MTNLLTQQSSNLQRKLEKSRQLCIGLPEGVYPLAEHLAKVMSVTTVPPEELSLYFICSLYDLSSNNNGFPHVSPEDFAKFTANKKIILRDFHDFHMLIKVIMDDVFYAKFCLASDVSMSYTDSKSPLTAKPKWKDWKIVKFLDSIFEF